MKYNFTVTIRREDGTTYMVKRVGNDEEQVIRSIRLPQGEVIVQISKDWAHPNY